jgi:hypothetical protein
MKLDHVSLWSFQFDNKKEKKRHLCCIQKISNPQRAFINDGKNWSQLIGLLRDEKES